MSKTNALKNHKAMTIASIIALVAFLGVASFSAISVTSIASIVEGKVLANKDGVPKAWDTYDTAESVQATTETQINDSYVEYTASIKNSDNNVVSLTHLSSYVEEEGTRGGFVPLAENTLEYTYNPEDKNSWSPVKISAPSNKEDGYKLDSALYIGEEGTNTDTIYFRYSVSPAEDGTVNDKVAFVTEDASGDAAVSVSNSSVEYQKTPVETASDTNTETNPSNTENGDSSYAKPLGVSSKAPTTTIVNASSLGAISISEETVTPSIIVVFVALGIFATSLIVYLIIRNKDTKKKSHRR